MGNTKHEFDITGLIKENNSAISELQQLVDINNGIIVNIERSTVGEALDKLRQQREVMLLKIENRELKASIEAKKNYNQKFIEHANRK